MFLLVILLDTFLILEECGGYTLLRLAENSHNMVEIACPEGRMTVAYLKDILNQAKLYVRPLQKDITDEAMKPYSTTKVKQFVIMLSFLLGPNTCCTGNANVNAYADQIASCHFTGILYCHCEGM